MIAATQITNTEVLAFIDVPVFKLMSHKFVFINRKDNRKCQKGKLYFKKIAHFFGKLATAKLWIAWMWNFQDTFEIRKQSFISAFSNYMIVSLNKCG